MSESNCMRCGKNAETEYGSDGQLYCSACIFYGINKQCWRCRMYLPASELQQYRGQFTCPYCIQDMRDEDRKANEPVVEGEKSMVTPLIIPETCERCGRTLETQVYIWNGKRLCKSCLGDEQKAWQLLGGGPSATPYHITLEPDKRAKKKGLIESLISEMLVALRLKSSQKRTVIIYESKMPIGLAKPMAEGATVAKKENPKPKSEGLMVPKTKDIFFDELVEKNRSERLPVVVPDTANSILVPSPSTSPTVRLSEQQPKRKRSPLRKTSLKKSKGKGKQ